MTEKPSFQSHSEDELYILLHCSRTEKCVSITIQKGRVSRHTKQVPILRFSICLGWPQIPWTVTWPSSSHTSRTKQYFPKLSVLKTSLNPPCQIPLFSALHGRTHKLLCEDNSSKTASTRGRHSITDTLLSARHLLLFPCFGARGRQCVHGRIIQPVVHLTGDHLGSIKGFPLGRLFFTTCWMI